MRAFPAVVRLRTRTHDFDGKHYFVGEVPAATTAVSVRMHHQKIGIAAKSLVQPDLLLPEDLEIRRADSSHLVLQGIDDLLMPGGGGGRHANDSIDKLATRILRESIEFVTRENLAYRLVHVISVRAERSGAPDQVEPGRIG
ncbi:hypothetical protein Prum_031640 [Phytohabitans rumicis]|uniref:Uncharacterized protein n=1 Tax=Phytohabitans rumicis TaxID=1076125 RepID=A0A6V8KWR1_9ACTN|nr:hypothetical protein Prum_031640 [Phytohabitans rumicis]